MWLAACLLTAVASLTGAASHVAGSAAMVDYRPERCAYCQADTWCDLRADGSRQCRACQVERYFERFLYPPIGATLRPWTRKVLRDLYGTVEMDTGLRRFRTAYISMGKQNGKSFLTGGLPLYHLGVEHEEDPEVYGAAAAREQASIVFKATVKMIKANPVLNAKYKIIASVKRIIRRDGQPGTYDVLSADGDLKDGIRPSLLIRDEIHRWKTSKAETLRDVTTKGQISRREPLDIQVTTAGAEYESPIWWNEYQYAKQIQADPSIAPDYYVALYEADADRIEKEPEYWKSLDARLAANPSHEAFGGHLRDASLVAELNKAIKNPAEKSKYLRYHLNVPIHSQENPVIDMAAWHLNGGGIDLRQGGDFDLDSIIDRWDLRGKPCWAGVDASWTTDLTSVVFVFPPFAGVPEYTLLPFFWMPQSRVPNLARVCRMPFQSWIARGFLTGTEGNAIDLNSVLARIRWGRDKFDLREVPYDRMNFRTEAMNLATDGITPVEVQQNFNNLSYPTKFLIEGYPDLKFRHGNHPVLNWMAACLQLQYDQKDNCQPTKPERLKSSKRIDGIQATVTALSRVLVAAPPSPYETRGVLVLG